MARPPAPPGPPPRHHRPPGSPPPPPAWSGSAPLGAARPSTPPASGASAGAVTAVALVTLLLGLVVGFFLGRATEADDTPASAPPLTSPSTSTSRPPGDTIPQTPTSAPGPAGPPSTDLAPDTIGSLEDPVPVGQSYILGLYEIEVRAVARDAEAALQDHNPSNPPAPPGEQHLMVEVAVRFTDEFGLGNPAAIPFLVSDGTAQWNDFDALCGSVPESLFDSGPLERGDEAVGNVCFTVPSDVVGNLRFGTEGFDGPVYFALPE